MQQRSPFAPCSRDSTRAGHCRVAVKCVMTSPLRLLLKERIGLTA